MFGSSAPFGSSQGGFGQQNTTPAFGSPAPAPFGGGGGFGAPAPAPFGSPAPAPGGFGGFGAPAPTPAFGGGSTFGTPAPAPAAFGTSGGFGASTSSPFGAPAPAPTGGMFGAPAPAPSGGLFGAPAPAPGGFGSTTSTGFGGGGFGSTSTTPPAFGGGSTFGAPAPAPSTGLFGAPAPAAGGFGGSAFGSTTSAFGAPAPAPAGGMFGAPAPAAGGMFGSTAPGGGGTKMTPFQVTNRQDGSQSINMQSITAMSQYEKKSFEELRFEDYSQGNRGSGSTGGSNTGGFGGFGSPAPAPSGGLFGAPAPAPGAFGAPAPAPGGFGGFGTPAPAPSTFGGFGSPAPAPFGAPTPAPAPFGAPAPAPGGFGGFGSPAPAPSGGLFGAKAPAPAPFGAPAPTPGLFGSTPAPAPFGAPAPTGGLFGATPAPAPFGAPAPTGGLFGSTPAPAPFGAPAPAPTGGLFGATPAPAPFGAPAPGGLFGATPAPAPFGAPAPTPGLFGATPAPAPFGAPAPTGGLFGATPAPAPFGAPAPTGGLFGAPAPAVQPMLAAPAVGAVMPPATNEILTAQLTALENKRKEIEKSDNFRGKPSESSSINGITLSEQEGLSSLTPVRASYPAYRASPRSNAKIRPRGFASPEKSVTPSLSRLGTGGKPMTTPDSLAASSQTRLVINPSPKPKMKLMLEAPSATNDQTPMKLMNQTSNASPGPALSFTRTQEQTPITPNVEVTAPPSKTADEIENSDEGADYYKKVISSPDTIPVKKSVAPTLTKSGYTCSPSIQELQKMAPEDLATVSSFSVERPGIGKIVWVGDVDVRGADLDNLVEIEDSPPSASVYAKEEEQGLKPALGTKLNRPAIITLEKVFPPENTSKERFTRKVEKATERNSAELIKYDAATGEWKFRVPHFSRYGLMDDDSDSEAENEQNFESGEREGRSPVVTKGILKQRMDSPLKTVINTPPVNSEEEGEENDSTNDVVMEDDSKVFTEAEKAFESMQVALKGKVQSNHTTDEEIGNFPEETKTTVEVTKKNRFIPGATDVSLASSRGGICSDLAMKAGVKSSTVDFGLQMGRSFRVGWSPDGSFLSLKAGGVLTRRRPVFCNRENDQITLLERHRESSLKIGSGNECPQFSLPSSQSDKKTLQSTLKSYAASSGSANFQKQTSIGKQAFSLLRCLLSSIENGGNDQLMVIESSSADQQILERNRMHAIMLWLVASCSQEVDGEIYVAKARNAKHSALLAAVTGGDIAKACSVAEEMGLFQFSAMLASGPESRSDILSQVISWTDSGVSPQIPDELRRMYFLIGGDSKMEEDIYRSKQSPLDWRRRLAMRLVYDASKNENLSSLIEEYEEKLKRGVVPYPKAQYLDPNSNQEIQCVLYRLLRFAKEDLEVSLREVIDPLGHTSSVHDFSLSFHLASAISAMGSSYSLTDIEEQNLINGFVAQLTTQGHWEWAVYVSLCVLGSTASQEWKMKQAKSLVIQNYKDDSPKAEECRAFLEGAGVPPVWFEEALALRCATDGDSYGYLNHMVHVSTDEIRSTLEQVLIPNMLFMSKEKLDESLKLLEVFAVDESSLACAVFYFFNLYQDLLNLEGAPQDEIDDAMPALEETCESVEQVFAKYKLEEELLHGPSIRFAPTVVPLSSFLAEGLSQISRFKLQLKALKSGISISSTASQILNLSQPDPQEFEKTGISARENICRWLM